jgi:hypothetical protein
MVRLRHSAAALALGGLVSCSADPALRPRTELVLLADTDIAELTHVEFEVRGDGHATELRRAPVRDDGAALSVGLVYTTGALGPITASARGFVGDEQLVAREAVVSFVEGRTLVVPLHLLRDCVGVACGASQSCTEEGCAPRELPGSSLAEWPSLPPDIVLTEPPAEAGMMEAGTDPGDGGTEPLDGGEPDAGSGSPDSGSDLDGGLDGGGADMDAATDAQTDAATDAQTDAATDAQTDAATDAQTDAATDAQTDAQTDAAIDGGTSCSGVVVDLTSDPNHCGSCTNVCSPSYIFIYHDVPACKASTCTWACAPLYADCNGTQIPFFDRCETNLGTDEDNCGACGRKCSGSETCVSGVCTKN